MKASTPELRALLASGSYEQADLWTITLSGGAMLRWTSADVDMTWVGNVFRAGPVLSRGAISEKVGLEVATCVLNIDAGEDDLIGGVPVIRFIARRGLDGATVKLERAFFPAWGQAVTGTIIRFSGPVTSVANVQGTHAEVTISAWTILLNVNAPFNLYQTGCLHTVYDSGCGLSAEAFAAASTVSAVATTLAFSSGLSGDAHAYAQGRVVFTSGANAGASRTIRDNDGAGGFSLVLPLPVAPSAGDGFKVYKGCDLTAATCKARFNNLGRFKATPFVPTPETAT